MGGHMDIDRHRTQEIVKLHNGIVANRNLFPISKLHIECWQHRKQKRKNSTVGN